MQSAAFPSLREQASACEVPWSALSRRHWVRPLRPSLASVFGHQPCSAFLLLTCVIILAFFLKAVAAWLNVNKSTIGYFSKKCEIVMSFLIPFTFK